MALYCLQYLYVFEPPPLFRQPSSDSNFQVQAFRSCNPAHQQGYTLLELLTSLTIVGILMSISMGAMGIIHSTQTTILTNDFVRVLHLARSEAIRRHNRITICQSSNGSQCTKEDRWENGWIMFSDLNRDRFLDENEDVLQVHEPLAPGYTLTWRPSGRNRDSISFTPDGGTNKVGTFSICSISKKGPSRTIIVYRTGRVRSDTVKPGGSPPDCPGQPA